MPPVFVIIGASLAGGVAAARLRQDGFDGDVILIGAILGAMLGCRGLDNPSDVDTLER